MTPVVALVIGIVWGSILTFALALAYTAGRPTPPINPDVQERKAARDFRPRLHGVADVTPVDSRDWTSS